jgi:cobalamin biosynthesis protein CobW
MTAGDSKETLERVPALVVSGFLGSGKTTLVRHLLADAQRRGERVAVISNEFGELGIDQALLGEGDEAFVELAGGCVCCQLTDELVETLQLLRERVAPHKVIIETSGIALPYDTQLNFYREPVAGWIGDDLAIVVVSAEQLHAGRDLAGTFEDQVTSAGLLLLNKIDLLEAGRLDAVERQLREIEPEAPVIRAVHGVVDPDLLFAPDPEGLSARPRTSGETRPHAHDAFESEELAIAAGVEPDALAGRLRALDVLRAKGFVETADGLRLVQVVGPHVALEPVRTPPPAELVGRVVVVRRTAGAELAHARRAGSQGRDG